MNSSSTSKSKKTTQKASTTKTVNKEANMKYEIANELGVNLGPEKQLYLSAAVRLPLP